MNSTEMNSTLAAVTAVTKPPLHTEILWAMFTWVLPAICAFGVVTNLINIVIFLHSKLKEDIYKYMLAYSVSDFFYTFFVFFIWISRSRYPLSSTYEAKWYEIYIFFTALNGLGTMSALVEIAISFDRLFLLKKTCMVTRKIPPYLVIGIMFIVSVLTAAVYASVRSIRKTVIEVYDPELNKTIATDSYSIYFNSFGTSDNGRILYVVVTVIKNIGTIIVMVVVNGFLMIEMNKYLKRKSKLLKKTKKSDTRASTADLTVSSTATGSTTDNNTNTANKELDKKKKKEDEENAMNKFVKMVLCLFAVYLIGNLSNAVIGVCFIYYSKYVFFKMLLTFGDVPQFLCRGLNIFIYYRFNSRFKEVYDNYWNRIKRFIQCK